MVKESDFKTDDGKVQILKIGILSIACCAPSDMPQDEIVQRVNAMSPCGTTLGWCWPKDKDFEENPQIKPVACADNASRTHYILGC